MITLILTSCPESLRGHLTRWLSEISAGVFVGKVNPRIREKLWDLVKTEVKNGRALMTYSTRETEQGYAYKVHRHDWIPEDHEGLLLIRRPSKQKPTTNLKPGWSNTARRRRFS